MSNESSGSGASDLDEFAAAIAKIGGPPLNDDAFKVDPLAASVAEPDLDFDMPVEVTESESDPDPKRDRDHQRASLSHSAASAFRQCARLFKLRYVDKIESVDREEALWLGSLYSDAHECRTKLIQAGAASEVAMGLTSMFLDHVMDGWESDAKKKRIRIVCEAMFRANIARWTPDTPRDPMDIGKMDSDFDVVSAEPYYKIRPRNPMTGAVSRSFDSPLRVDRLLRRKDSGKLWIHERKTASSIDDVVDWVWTDVQTRLYSKWVGEVFGEPVEGVLYDIAGKPRHTQKEGWEETDEEWKLRLDDKLKEAHASLTEKKKRLPLADEWSKEESRVRGLKSMQRGSVIAETDADFFTRVFAACDETGSQVRYWHNIDDADIEDAMMDFWDVMQQILDARKRKRWPKNTLSCRKWGAACEFVPLCKGSMKLESLVFDQDGTDRMANLHAASLYRPRGRSGDHKRVEKWILGRVTQGRPIHLGTDSTLSRLTMDDIGDPRFMISKQS